MNLTPKQQLFVAEYLKDLNATASYKRAGYKGKGNAAESAASRLLSDVKVKRAIQEAMDKRQGRIEVTQDRIVAELAKIAFGDQRAVMKWGADGVELLESELLTDDHAAMVAEVSQTVSATGGSLKLKTHDKVGALKLLGEHLGMFKQKMELTGKNGGPIETRNLSDLTDEELEHIAAASGG